jgi:hypothetical protein
VIRHRLTRAWQVWRSTIQVQECVLKGQIHPSLRTRRRKKCTYDLVETDSLVENMSMDTEMISIRVDAEAARTFRSMPDQDRRKLEALLSIRLSEATRPGESLNTVVQEIGDKAKERGLTPEILKSLLDEE